MPAIIRITQDKAHKLVLLDLSGNFSLDDVNQLDIERRRAVDGLKCGANQHLTLCDVSQTTLSTPDVVAALQQTIGNPAYRSKRCAMVVDGTLARLQARRAVARGDVMMFDTRADALRWLLRGNQSEAA